MRSGTQATEGGNNFEHFVRAWRLADMCARARLDHKDPGVILFQDARRRPWDDIVEIYDGETHVWQIKHLQSPLRVQALTELLLPLADQSLDATSAKLAFSQIVAPPRDLDPLLIHHLAEASRKADGHLSNFVVTEPTEQRCLARLAELLDATPEATFATLRRLHVEILYGKDNLKLRATRAVSQLFEDPDQVFDGLLGFVLDLGAIGVQIPYEKVEREVFARFPARTAHSKPSAKVVAEPTGDILTWFTDEAGKSLTTWLSPTAPQQVVGTAAGIYIAASQRLWQWQRDTIRLPLLVDHPIFSDDFDPECPRVRLEDVPSACLLDLINETPIRVGLVQPHSDHNFTLSVDPTVRLLAGVNNLAWVHSHAYIDGGGARPFWETKVEVLDLSSGRPIELWSPSEAEELLKRHQAAARTRLNPQLCEPSEKATVTMVEPRYDSGNDARSTVQFTWDVAHYDADGSWDDYSASVRLDLDWFPPAWAEHAQLPPLLRDHWHRSPHRRAAWGWSRVSSSPDVQQRLRQIFRIAQIS